VVTVKGEPNEEGMIIDFVRMKSIVREKVLGKLDHSYINKIIDQPTAENIARWIWMQVEADLAGDNRVLWEIEVWETRNNGVVLTREDMK